MSSFLLVLLFTSPAYVLPLVLGPIILRTFRKDPLARFAGFFSMKPVVATPLWILLGISFSDLNFPGRLLQLQTIIVGLGLTLILMWEFRALLKSERKTVFLLLACDSVRWINTLLWTLRTGNMTGQMPFYLAGLIFTNVYALMAFFVMRSRARRRSSEPVGI